MENKIINGEGYTIIKAELVNYTYIINIFPEKEEYKYSYYYCVNNSTDYHFPLFFDWKQICKKKSPVNKWVKHYYIYPDYDVLRVREGRGRGRKAINYYYFMFTIYNEIGEYYDVYFGTNEKCVDYLSTLKEKRDYLEKIGELSQAKKNEIDYILNYDAIQAKLNQPIIFNVEQIKLSIKDISSNEYSLLGHVVYNDKHTSISSGGSMSDRINKIEINNLAIIRKKNEPNDYNECTGEYAIQYYYYVTHKDDEYITMIGNDTCTSVERAKQVFSYYFEHK